MFLANLLYLLIKGAKSKPIGSIQPLYIFSKSVDRVQHVAITSYTMTYTVTFLQQAIVPNHFSSFQQWFQIDIIFEGVVSTD